MTVTPQNALKLSAWLAREHPALFRQMLSATRKLQRSPLGQLGMFGDDSTLDFSLPSTPDLASSSDLSNLTLDSLGSSADTSVASLDTISPDSAVGYTPTAADVSPVTTAIAAPAPAGGIAGDTLQSSGGFWSGVADSVGSMAGAVGKVASGLLSPQAMTAMAGVAGAYFKAQSQNAQTQAQAQIVNAQMARVAQGAAPAPITYSTNPYTGQVAPVYVGGAGYQPVTPSLLSQLMSPAQQAPMSGLFTALLIGGAAVLVFALMRGTRPPAPAGGNS